MWISRLRWRQHRGLKSGGGTAAQITPAETGKNLCSAAAKTSSRFLMVRWNWMSGLEKRGLRLCLSLAVAN